MPKPKKYCKAHLLGDFRKYSEWSEDATSARKETIEVDGVELENPRVLDRKSILYLHDNYAVTDGVHRDENVIFDDISRAWKSFCKEQLKFQVPVFRAKRKKVRADA